eukprot:CAMPEP_0198367116 /NCGR_PEP_ID=MMETSP1450-20131203/155027_1 /TAXON_ID=753684 ORGANISM="Madagascaria erythrocladiodes, Strain CCMP3234" /NCGR_SAMPLE_ID=MMETSP1450 /ASSEMBLY_ACC=CAM_ASM_001115 /LENGTH=220 /DNA_ID=CAMNT_0044074595 /DNA_START=44 /DNA_END=706 /DNA_ORIENTATION=-
MAGRLGRNNQFTNTAPDVDYCYVVGTSVANGLNVANDTVLDAYTVANPKEWNNDAIQYESYRRDFDRIITGFTPGQSIVRMYSNRVGTFGANAAVPPPTPEAIPPTLEPQRSLTGSAIAGVTGLLLFIILAILIAWLVATRCFIIAAAPVPVESDFTYVERDVYGRGAVLGDDDGPSDSDPGMSTREQSRDVQQAAEVDEEAEVDNEGSVDESASASDSE